MTNELFVLLYWQTDMPKKHLKNYVR